MIIYLENQKKYKKYMKSLRVTFFIVITAILGAGNLFAQQVLTLDDCRNMAIENNKSLNMARTKIEMAGYDKQIARSYYFPNVTASGTYMYNEKNLQLISDEMSGKLQNIGTTMGGLLEAKKQELMKAIMGNPATALEMQKLMQSPLLQTVVGSMNPEEMAKAMNAIGAKLDKAFEMDMHNVFAGVISIQQPLFMGGEIVAQNKIATLAEELSKSKYNLEYQDIIVGVDQAYWQIVSIANKRKLAAEYANLLHSIQNDVEISVKEGVATESDVLQIKVKANEADILKTKADNGLVLAKMFLCKQIGIDLNSQIDLADENLDEIPVPILAEAKSMEDIYMNRPEIRSLDLATQIFDKKIVVAQSSMLPKIALTANYLVSNPNAYNGFRKNWSGMYNVGVAMRIPIFHGFNARSKTRKARAEAVYYRMNLDNAKDMINLEVKQLRQQQEEILQKLSMTESNLKSAEENLRTAKIGFEAGVIPTNTVLAAHTAWLKAHSENIDAGVELQMNNVKIRKAEGEYRSDIQATSETQK